MKGVLAILFVFLTPLIAVADWMVETPVVSNGELAVLRWQGDHPPGLTVGTFAGKTIYSEETSRGAVILIGVDIKNPAGAMPIELVSAGNHGLFMQQSLSLEVTIKDRGVSRITLPPEMVTPKGAELLARIEHESSQMRAIFSQENGPLLADSFRRPVHEEVNSHFGKKRVLNGLPKAPHSGTDFRSPSGTLVRSPAKGDVAFVGDLYYTGNTVIIDHGAGLYSLYAHLLKPLCTLGQRIDAGQPLGKVGSTGRSTGAHLHWTVRLREVRIDPMSILERFGSKTP